MPRADNCLSALGMKDMNKLISTISVLIVFGCLLITANFALADARSDKYGLDTAHGVVGDDLMSTGEGSTAAESIAISAGTILGAFLAFLGIIFLALLVYGGLIWMTAAGNDARVAKARNLIVAAVIGLIIVLAAYAGTTYLGDSLNS